MGFTDTNIFLSAREPTLVACDFSLLAEVTSPTLSVEVAHQWPQVSLSTLAPSVQAGDYGWILHAQAPLPELVFDDYLLEFQAPKPRITAWLSRVWEPVVLHAALPHTTAGDFAPRLTSSAPYLSAQMQETIPWADISLEAHVPEFDGYGRLGTEIRATLTVSSPTLSGRIDSSWDATGLQAQQVELSANILRGQHFNLIAAAKKAVARGTGGVTTSGVNLTAPTPTVAGGFYPQVEWNLVGSLAKPFIQKAVVVSQIPATPEYDPDTGELLDDFDVWAINVSTSAHSSLSLEGVTDMAVIGGKTYCATENGLCELKAPSSSSSVNAEVVFDKTDFGYPERTRITDAVITCRANGALILTVTTDDMVEREYPVVVREGMVGTHKKRVKIGGAVAGNHVQVGIKNYDGRSFEVDSVSLTGKKMSRV